MSDWSAERILFYKDPDNWSGASIDLNWYPRECTEETLKASMDAFLSAPDIARFPILMDEPNHPRRLWRPDGLAETGISCCPSCGIVPPAMYERIIGDGWRVFGSIEACEVDVRLIAFTRASMKLLSHVSDHVPLRGASIDPEGLEPEEDACSGGVSIPTVIAQVANWPHRIIASDPHRAVIEFEVARAI